jgi:hypothetical protein
MKVALPLLVALGVAEHAQTVLVKPYVQPGNGATLYKIEFAKSAAKMLAENPANYQPLTAKLTSDQHSFSLVDLTPTIFEKLQFSTKGEELDRFKITRAAK